MSLSEFAEYSAAVPKEQHEDYNRMLSFVEDVVMQKAAKLVCRDCMTHGAPVLSTGYYSHSSNGAAFICHADGIYKALTSEGTKKL